MFEIEGTVTMTAPVVGYRGIEPRTGDAPEGLSPVASLAYPRNNRRYLFSVPLEPPL